MVKTTSILPLNVNGVSVRRNEKYLLDGVSLKFSPEGFTIIMGPNGSGKTTLLRLLHGLERPRDGTVNWTIPQDETRDKQTFVFQTPIMLRRTVLNNLLYPLIVANFSKSEAFTQAGDWLAKISMKDKANIDAHQLSGGERQKLAVARALISEPQVLFLDEPTTNLDGVSTREIETILNTASSSGTRIIMSTHDIGQAKRLATDVVFLNQGRVCETGSAPKFFETPKSLEAKAFLRGDIVE